MEFQVVRLQAERCFAEYLFLDKCLSSQKSWQGGENGQRLAPWTGLDGTVSESWQSRRNQQEYTAWWCNGRWMNPQSGDWGLGPLPLNHIITLRKSCASWTHLSYLWNGGERGGLMVPKNWCSEHCYGGVYAAWKEVLTASKSKCWKYKYGIVFPTKLGFLPPEILFLYFGFFFGGGGI